jgi:hypothetical protein
MSKLMAVGAAVRGLLGCASREGSRRPLRGALLGLVAGACIMRTAPAPGGSPTPAAAPSPATEAAESRIAGLARAELLGGAGSGAFQVAGEVKKVELTPITVEGQPFKDAIRAAIKEASGHEWAVQLSAATAAPIEAGDALLATFYLRVESPQEGGVGQTEFVFELAGAPYTKSIQYPVQGTSGWSKIEVRFKAARAYAAGEAHMLFRLGYDPEVIELGGIKVESFGKQVPVSALPSTQAADRRRERAAAVAAREAADAAAALPPTEGGDLHFEVVTGQVIRPISPYVYGINSQPADGVGATVRRMGGNRQTGYNWEINASNAGSDYNHSSDEWPCAAMGYSDCGAPGAQFVDFALSNRRDGLESIATVPLVDYVSADKRGAVPESDKAPSNRWDRSYPKKPGPFAATPDLSDGAVYQDEFVSFLVGKLGKAAQGGIKFYSLDNEPALWPSTHPRIHPAPTRYDEMVSRSEAAAAAIVKLDPTAIVLGGVMFGWSEYLTLNDAPDAQEQNATYGTYLDYFLASMKRLEDQHHHRLVHALDIHWYPEARGAARVTDKAFDAKTVAARLQAPRSLWDPGYLEKSWIASTWGKPIRLIPWMQERIAARYPGTKLTMTEYNFGAGDHISGGLAQADALGVFGREGLYLATYWGDGAGNGPLPGFVKAAFQLYRNYDGKGGAYGDTAVTATSADIAKASIYAATDTKHPGALTVIVINRDQRTVFNGDIDLEGSKCARARVYTFDASAPNVRSLPDLEIKNSQIACRLPPLSATLFVCAGR